MANVQNSNTIHLDSTGNIGDNNLKVTYVIITSTGAAPRIILRDGNTANDIKLDIKLLPGNQSGKLNFAEAPIVFPNGVNVGTITNCNVTLIVKAEGRS